jgi:hypothetical protein
MNTISDVQSWPWPLYISVGSLSYIITGGTQTLVMVWLLRSWLCFGDNLVQFSFNLEHVFAFSFSSGLRLIRVNNIISLCWTKWIIDHVTDELTDAVINRLADWIVTNNSLLHGLQELCTRILMDNPFPAFMKPGSVSSCSQKITRYTLFSAILI